VRRQYSFGSALNGVAANPRKLAAMSPRRASYSKSATEGRPKAALLSCALDQATIDRLGAIRGPGESYSDMTILRALKGDRAPVFASKRPALIEPALT
jgi:hypothetical protein